MAGADLQFAYALGESAVFERVAELVVGRYVVLEGPATPSSTVIVFEDGRRTLVEHDGRLTAIDVDGRLTMVEHDGRSTWVDAPRWPSGVDVAGPVTTVIVGG